MQEKKTYHSGFIAIVGRPNVGKSTLLNALLGEKIAIVSNRPQTTRNRILGVCTQPDSQIVFLDTPGIHTPRTRLGEYMMQTVQDALQGIDGLLVVVDVTSVTKQDRDLVTEMSNRKIKKTLVLNKIDQIPKEQLLALILSLSKDPYDEIVPISALTGDGVDELKQTLIAMLPEGPQYFPEDTLTDQPERFLCGEMIREKALYHLKDEVPHGIGVEVMSLKKIGDGLTEIDATIYCERPAHKAIIIGKQGSMLKQIGMEARIDIEALLDTHINLKLWVKVKEGWRNRREDLRTLGYTRQE
ncbi:MAG TPA: GTPase Era [Candidatus Limiplasma sp.]|nr:GTPase Era [Candidatus Limiplasma sp.]